jgi:hypothetical protein
VVAIITGIKVYEGCVNDGVTTKKTAIEVALMSALMSPIVLPAMAVVQTFFMKWLAWEKPMKKKNGEKDK